jgi:Rab GDP dissociation inhibitor
MAGKNHVFKIICLIHSLSHQVVEGTYVYQYQKAGFFSNEKHIHKVPATDIEALKSPLLSMMEKNRCKNFFKYCATWDSKDSTQSI